MSAAHAFGLDGLQRHCEIALSHHLTLENVASVYKTAKLYEASYLVTYCNGFMLRHLPALVASGGGSGGGGERGGGGGDRHASYRRLVFSSRVQSQDALNGLLHTLTDRMLSRRRGGGGCGGAGGDEDTLASRASSSGASMAGGGGKLDRSVSGSVLSVVTTGDNNNGNNNNSRPQRPPPVPLRSTPV